ncbi:MAG: hypothetical protein M4579_000912 [Chaenotheca gracillima]|nr:MAG: hypothetical protein M4579_000912 [Chaenotheca gracillima]
MGKPLVVMASDNEYDQIIFDHWTEEGYDPRVLGTSASLAKQVGEVYDDLEDGEKYAIVAYGAAASDLLKNGGEALQDVCAFVVYYPTEPIGGIPSHGLFHAHVVDPPSAQSTFSHHLYVEVEPGFAERESGKFDKIAANLAWSRTLGIVRKGFGIEVDLEKKWEEHLALEFAVRDADATMETMVSQPYVNHVPTITGGIGYHDLHRFYRDYFIPSNPPSTEMRLISRTIGVDRVVDEMYFSFDHTLEIPWMLPGVPPTGRRVEVALVGVVCIRGGKLYHEHLYWDQASVLVQVGLLDAKLGAVGMGQNGVDRLPILGAETARKVLDEHSVESNELIPGW